MGSIAQLIGQIAPMLSMMFGIEVEQRLGVPIIDMVEAKLKQASMSPGQRAIAEAQIARFTALSTAANALVTIAQPSSEEQARMSKIEAELEQLKATLIAA